MPACPVAGPCPAVQLINKIPAVEWPPELYDATNDL